jgi:hypothetical protein
MKLDSILMREAFETEDWEVAVRALQSVFGIDLDACVLSVHRDVDHCPEIVACTKTNEYCWSMYSGFKEYLHTNNQPFSIAVYANIKPWKF